LIQVDSHPECVHQL